MGSAQSATAFDADDDDALVHRVADRDEDAFRELIDRHAARPYRIAWRMLGDGAEAEDVAQEAMLRLWQSASGWRGGGPGVAAWLTRVATNLCLDRLRARSRLGAEPPPDRVDDAPLADALLEGEQARAAVIAALDTLSERQRAAIVLTYYEELANAAAAEVLDMNLKAFESLLLRARRALRLQLVENGDG